MSSATRTVPTLSALGVTARHDAFEGVSVASNLLRERVARAKGPPRQCHAASGRSVVVLQIDAEQSGVHGCRDAPSRLEPNEVRPPSPGQRTSSPATTRRASRPHGHPMSGGFSPGGLEPPGATCGPSRAGYTGSSIARSRLNGTSRTFSCFRPYVSSSLLPDCGVSPCGAGDQRVL